MALPGGTFALTPDRTVPRFGYGYGYGYGYCYSAMQLAGSAENAQVWGPPADRDGALAVLREAPERGIRHIDTADFCGPFVTNKLIREALHPYADDLTIVTKVGSVRDDDGNWVFARGFDSPQPGSLAESFTALAELQQQGAIPHLGVNTANAEQITEAQSIAPVVTVQNFYNVATLGDDAMIDQLASEGISDVPYFPLGGFSPLQSTALASVAARRETSPMAVALAWLLQRSPNILLIPGTSSVAHLRENIAGAWLPLDAEALAELDAIAG